MSFIQKVKYSLKLKYWSKKLTLLFSKEELNVSIEIVCFVLVKPSKSSSCLRSKLTRQANEGHIKTNTCPNQGSSTSDPMNKIQPVTNVLKERQLILMNCCTAQHIKAFHVQIWEKSSKALSRHQFADQNVWTTLIPQSTLFDCVSSNQIFLCKWCRCRQIFRDRIAITHRAYSENGSKFDNGMHR